MAELLSVAGAHAQWVDLGDKQDENTCAALLTILDCASSKPVSTWQECISVIYASAQRIRVMMAIISPTGNGDKQMVTWLKDADVDGAIGISHVLIVRESFTDVSVFSVCQCVPTSQSIKRMFLLPHTFLLEDVEDHHLVDLLQWPFLQRADHNLWCVTGARLSPVCHWDDTTSVGRILVSSDNDQYQNLYIEQPDMHDTRYQQLVKDSDQKLRSHADKSVILSQSDLLSIYLKLQTCDGELPLHSNGADWIFMVKWSDQEFAKTYCRFPATGPRVPVRCVVFVQDKSSFRMAQCCYMRCNKLGSEPVWKGYFPVTSVGDLLRLRFLITQFCSSPYFDWTQTAIPLQSLYCGSLLHCDDCATAHPSRDSHKYQTIAANAFLRKAVLFSKCLESPDKKEYGSRVESAFNAVTGVRNAEQKEVKNDDLRDRFCRLQDCFLSPTETARSGLKEAIYSKELEMFQNEYGLSLVATLQWNGLMESNPYSRTLSPFNNVAHFVLHMSKVECNLELMMAMCNPDNHTRVRSAFLYAFPGFMRATDHSDEHKNAHRFLVDIGTDRMFVTQRYLYFVTPLIHWILAALGVQMRWSNLRGEAVYYRFSECYQIDQQPCYVDPGDPMNAETCVLSVDNQSLLVATLLHIADIMLFLGIDVVAVCLLSVCQRWVTHYQNKAEEIGRIQHSVDTLWSSYEGFVFGQVDERFTFSSLTYRPQIVADKFHDLSDEFYRDWGDRISDLALSMKLDEIEVHQLRQMKEFWLRSAFHPPQPMTANNHANTWLPVRKVGMKQAFERICLWVLSAASAYYDTGTVTSPYTLLWRDGIPANTSSSVFGAFSKWLGENPNHLVDVAIELEELLICMGHYDLLLSIGHLVKCLQTINKHVTVPKPYIPFVRPFTHPSFEDTRALSGTWLRVPRSACTSLGRFLDSKEIDKRDGFVLMGYHRDNCAVATALYCCPRSRTIEQWSYQLLAAARSSKLYILAVVKYSEHGYVPGDADQLNHKSLFPDHRTSGGLLICTDDGCEYYQQHATVKRFDRSDRFSPALYDDILLEIMKSSG